MSQYVWGDQDTQFFFSLSPDLVLSSVDSLGFESTGRCLALNSLENRVYEVEVAGEHGENRFVVAKFYRPGRWSKEQIQDEHDFLQDLVASEIPVVAPLSFEGKTLFEMKEQGLVFAVFPKKMGRVPDELLPSQLELLGRLLARVHSVGSQRKAHHRLLLSPENFGLKNLEFLLKNGFVPSYLTSAYESAVKEICQASSSLFKGISFQRIHGDCHLGNIIFRDGEGPFLVDFDDMAMGPVVQDIWLCTPGVDSYAKKNREILLQAYLSMRDFDYRELKLIDPLMALRLIHFSAWIAKRWEDPSFKNAFVQFGTDDYWRTQINDLQEILNRINQETNPYGSREDYY